MGQPVPHVTRPIMTHPMNCWRMSNQGGTKYFTKSQAMTRKANPPPKRLTQTFNVPLTGTRSSQEGSQEEDTSNTISAPALCGTHLAPSYCWDQINEKLKMATIDKTALHDCVVTFIFPKLKFVTGSGMMMECSTEMRMLCLLEMAGCNQVH
jgi:hypothetical protein